MNIYSSSLSFDDLGILNCFMYVIYNFVIIIIVPLRLMALDRD
jgi:hypothetical protein